MIYKGLYFSDFTLNQIHQIEQEYPTSNTNELASKMGLKIHSIYNIASKLRIKKTSEFLSLMSAGKFSHSGTQYRFKKGHQAWNKGKKGLQIGGVETQFRQGNLPHNTKYDGCISIRSDNRGRKYKYIRVSKSKWEPLHRWVWIRHNGVIPKGFNIQFKDNNSLNCDFDNLYIISRSKQIDQNTLHRFPEELKQSIRLIHKLEKLTKDEKNRIGRAECAAF